MDDVDVLSMSLKSSGHLMTLEALWIKELKPALNTKEEYKSKNLVIKL